MFERTAKNSPNHEAAVSIASEERKRLPQLRESLSMQIEATSKEKIRMSYLFKKRLLVNSHMLLF